ncbi:MAG: hypothetical protein RLZZ251_513 [Actinomycetota bacterium]|jgi:hypothetical protein
MKVPFSVTIIIAAPREEVWRKLVHWSSQGEWMALTYVHASHQGADDSGIGTTIEAFTGVGKLGVLDRMKVTQWQPPEFCAVDHYGRLIRGLGEFRLTRISQDQGEATKFHWYEEIEGPRFLLLLLKPGILVGVYLTLRKFAKSFVKIRPE